MSEIGENLKNILKKGFEAIGSKASDLASSAKQKVGEYNLTNQKNDLFSSIGRKIYELSLSGAAVPEGLEEELKQIAEIDKELGKIQEEKKSEEACEAAGEDAGDAGRRTAEEEPVSGEPAAAEYAAKDDSDVPVIEIEEEEEKTVEECPLSSAINDLFENMPPVDKMVDKVNSSLDDLGENLRKFSSEFDKQLNDFSDQMMGKDDSGEKE